MSDNDFPLIPQKKFQILIIEDDPITAKIHRIRLQAIYPHEILIFSNGKEALDHLEKSPDYHFLILLDLDMPFMDGPEFLEKKSTLDRVNPIYVIVVSCSIISKEKTTVLKYPEVLDYLIKPLTTFEYNNLSHYPKLIPYFSNPN